MVAATLPLHPAQQSSFVLTASLAFSTIKTSWTRLRKSPWHCLEGLFWGTAWSFSLCECYACIRELSCCSLEDLRLQGGCDKLRRLIKATVNAVFGLFGYSTSTLEWADRMRLITLGKLAPLVQRISYLSLFINAGFGMEKCFETLKTKKCAFIAEKDPATQSMHAHHYRCALLDLASHISGIAWSLIGLVKLCFVVAVSPILANAVLLVSCAFAIASFSYGIYVAVKFDQPTGVKSEE
jgi:hypothetical protein